MQQPFFEIKITCSFNHWSPLLSIWKSFGRWPSSKDCIRLGSGRIEPTKKKEVIYYFKVWKQDITRRLYSGEIENHWEFSAICNDHP